MIYCLGEALIDFTMDEAQRFIWHPGGAPLNVCATITRLGKEAIMLTQVGNDVFGDYLLEHMNEAGINTSYVHQSNIYKTGLAFVSHDDKGDRSFQFYRDNVADLNMPDLNISFTGDDILHFGSVNLSTPRSRDYHRMLIHKVKDQGGLISFDPNVRLMLWEDENECRETIKLFLPFADILKVSDDELSFITEKDPEEGIEELLGLGIAVILYTEGEKGMTLYTNEGKIHAEALSVNAIDTTGAGDASIGAFLAQLVPGVTKVQLTQYCLRNAEKMLRVANGIAGLVVTKEGGMSALPSHQEIKRLFI